MYLPQNHLNPLLHSNKDKLRFFSLGLIYCIMLQHFRNSLSYRIDPIKSDGICLRKKSPFVTTALTLWLALILAIKNRGLTSGFTSLDAASCQKYKQLSLTGCLQAAGELGGVNCTWCSLFIGSNRVLFCDLLREFHCHIDQMETLCVGGGVCVLTHIWFLSVTRGNSCWQLRCQKVRKDERLELKPLFSKYCN